MRMCKGEGTGMYVCKHRAYRGQKRASELLYRVTSLVLVSHVERGAIVLCRFSPLLLVCKGISEINSSLRSHSLLLKNYFPDV